MNWKLAAGLLGLALLAGWLLFSGTGGRGSNGRGAAAPPADHERAEQPVEAPPALLGANRALESEPSASTTESARAAVEVELDPTGRADLAVLTGRLVESDGLPVPGMRVALLEFQGELLFDGRPLGEEEPSLELEETLTGPDGRFQLGGARASAIHGLGIDLDGPRATLRVIDQALVHRERTDIGDVVLAPFGVLTGRVVDEHGAPLAGARVRCAPLPAEILQARPQEIRGDSAVAINLAILGGQGHTILEFPGWIRDLIERLPVPTTRSGADGAFRLAGVPLAPVVGGIDMPGRVGYAFGPLDMAGGTHDLGRVELGLGRTVRGVVEEPSGDPVAGAEVRAGAELVPGIVALLQPCGATDEDGRFELTGVAEEGQIVAAARRSPHEAWGTTVAPRADGVLIELESLVRLTVLVRDAAGEPLPGAAITLTPVRPPSANAGFPDVLALLPKPASPRAAFVEVEPGRHVNAGLAAGRYQITARVAGLAPGFVETECRASENEVTLVCPRGHAVALTVVDAATRQPVPGARATVLHASSSGLVKLGVAETDAAGQAVLGPLSSLPDASGEGFFPAQTMLLVEHPRHGDHSAALDPQVSTLVVELTAGGALAGRVHWGGAVPTRLYMLSIAYRDADDFLELFHLPRFALTGLDGAFRCSNLAPGKHTVELTDRFLHQDPLGLMAAEFEPPKLWRGDVEIRSGDTTELVIDLTPTGRGATASLVGRVRYEGRGLAGAQVSVSGNEDLRVSTDEGGRFETPAFSIRESTSVEIEGDVPLGAGEKRHMRLHQASLELADGEVHRIELDLYPLTVRARVVAEPGGDPISGAEVTARMHRDGGDSGPLGDPASTGVDGGVELVVFEPGEYFLDATAEGFTRASCAVKVSAEGSPDPALLRLERAVVCAGRVQPALANGPARFSYMWVQGEDGANSSGTRLEAPDYAFELEGLPPGKYTAHLYLDGQQGEDVTFELGPEGDDDLVLVFTPAVQEDEAEDE